MSQLIQPGLTQKVQVEADPDEGEEDAKTRKNEAVEFETPGEGAEGGTLEVDDQTLGVIPPWGHHLNNPFSLLLLFHRSSIWSSSGRGSNMLLLVFPSSSQQLLLSFHTYCSPWVQNNSSPPPASITSSPKCTLNVPLIKERLSYSLNKLRI